jgi:uncharacterized membrane protein YidH (DUF202 family)
MLWFGIGADTVRWGILDLTSSMQSPKRSQHDRQACAILSCTALALVVVVVIVVVKNLTTSIAFPVTF